MGHLRKGMAYRGGAGERRTMNVTGTGVTGFHSIPLRACNNQRGVSNAVVTQIEVI